MPTDKPMLSKLLGALEFTVPGKHHRALYEAMFCLAFRAFLRIGEMTVQSANATNPNLLQWKQLEIRHILDSDLHSLQAQQRQALDPNNKMYHLAAGLPSSDHEGILVCARCYSRSFISVLPQRACRAPSLMSSSRSPTVLSFLPQTVSNHYCCSPGYVR